VASYQRFVKPEKRRGKNLRRAEASILQGIQHGLGQNEDPIPQVTKPDHGICKVLKTQEVSNKCDLAGKPGGKDRTSIDLEALPPDDRLVMVVETWNSLPEAVRVGITALVRASVPTVSQPSGSPNA